MLWIYATRTIAIFFIVLLHSASFYYNNSEINSYPWWIGNIFNSASRWAVPVFVMISGVLLLDENKNLTMFDFYKKRSQKIIIPTIFWSSFYSAIWYLQLKNSGDQIDFKRLAMNFISGHSYYHLWFLFMIAGMYIFTPFLKKLVHVMKKNELNVFLLITFLLSLLYVIYAYKNHYQSNFWPLWCLPFIPYFILGYEFRENNIHIKKISLIFIIAVLIFCIIISTWFVAVDHNSNNSYFFEPLSIFVIPLSLSTFILLKKTNFIFEKFFKMLSPLTLGIYIIHPFFLGVFFKLFKKISMEYPCSILIAATVTTVILSFITSYLLKKTPYLRHVV